MREARLGLVNGISIRRSGEDNAVWRAVGLACTSSSGSSASWSRERRPTVARPWRSAMEALFPGHFVLPSVSVHQETS